MEEVLDTYHRDYSDQMPLVCMDEASKQLLGQTRTPLPLSPGHPVREDYHYERFGTQAIFMFFNPLSGQRRVSCRDSRIRLDWAEEIKQLLEVDYPRATRVTLVCDNLNIHDKASLYAAFPAQEAHELARRLEIVYTPRHGSWLNVAEIELSVLSRQCLNRRIPSAAELTHQLHCWQTERNARKSTVKWRFTTSDARCKLHHLYPSF